MLPSVAYPEFPPAPILWMTTRDSTCDDHYFGIGYYHLRSHPEASVTQFLRMGFGVGNCPD